MTTKQLYRPFYRQCYRNSGGWIPMMPLAHKLELGDFGQIRQGRLRPLGNIGKLRLVYQIKSTDRIALNPDDWQLEAGVEKIFGSTQTRTDDQNSLSTWSKQVLAFGRKGDFVFYGAEPKARFIANWSEFKQDITLKLTQADYSFRDVYVVTAVATVGHWGLAIAGADGAQLELAAETGEADHFAMLSHRTAIAEQSRHIAVFEQSAGRHGYFFKAKKLVLSDQKKDQLISQMLQQNVALEADELANWLSSDLLNRVQANELNPSTCLDYFDWVDVSLDDVEKLC
jgi:hypothetical protein